MLLADFIREGTRSLGSLYPEREAHSIVLMLCEALLGTRSYTHIVEPGTEVEPGAVPALEAALERLLAGEPVQYVTGFAEFCGFRFRVTPDVLIPRPETEQLVREAVGEISRLRGMRSTPVRVLDLCTGSGCIAWSVALLAPGTEVVGVDVSDAALSVARGQDFSDELKSTGAVAPLFVKADILDTEQDFPYGVFDLVMSNPPYIMESEKTLMRGNVLDFEPALALFVPDGDPLLFYRAVAEWSRRFLAPDGKGISEINERIGDPTAEVFRAAGYPHTVVIDDIFDRNRFVKYSKNAF
jgi:release factor glutamine methyltransferase